MANAVQVERYLCVLLSLIALFVRACKRGLMFVGQRRVNIASVGPAGCH